MKSINGLTYGLLLRVGSSEAVFGDDVHVDASGSMLTRRGPCCPMRRGPRLPVSMSGLLLKDCGWSNELVSGELQS